MSTLYRMSTENDIDALVEFWKENSGWDQIDRAEWEKRFYNTPAGASSVAMAVNEDTGEILGQMIFIPTEICVDGQLVKARRPFAMVVKKTFHQGMGILNLITFTGKMYNHAINTFTKLGVGLIHMMPDPRWVRAFKFLTKAQIGSFELWSLPLCGKANFSLPGEYEVKPISASDEQINLLLQKNDRHYGCVLPRNTSTLAWKVSLGNYHLLGLFHQNELIGLSASQPKEKDKQWLICDVLAADNLSAFDAVIKATYNAALAYVQHHETAIGKVALLVTPLMERRIESLGFQKDNYRFPFVVQVLDKTIPKAQVAPERWYVSAND